MSQSGRSTVSRRGNDILIRCHVQPGARKDEIRGLHGDRVHIRIAAPAVDGHANMRLKSFVARRFGLPKTQVHLQRGERGRNKVVRVEDAGVLPAELRAVLG